MSIKKIALVYFNAGGGHRAAAMALQQVLQAPEQPPCEVRLVNLIELLDPPQRFKRATGLAPEDLYNLRLARGWTMGLAQELKLLQGMIRMAHPWLLRTLRAHWDATAPDLVVSLIPNFNRALYESVMASPGRRCATVMTDLADHPPHFWIEPGQPAQVLVCGTPRAAAQALAAGHAPAQVKRVSGMVLRPAFHGLAPLAADERAERQRALGLHSGRPIGLVMFGGQGSMQMLRIARGLPEVQLVLVCGHNARLATRLHALATAAPGGPHAVLGFVPDMAGLMQLADFFIGKPGPGSLSEAVQMGLPVVTFENRWTMPQERYNAHWVRNEGLGEVVDSVKAVPEGVARLLDQLPQRRSRVLQVRNRAVFEVAALLRELAGVSTAAAVEPALAVD
ncbi:galactosyldiacylglycerol synthase [Ideonella azotifigens]|nr:glycosyltransferase [Ideonella azotifigens]MCD2344033.1 galactosyldiacylglycerol synthase [Ideonella azotifigens]